MLTKKPGIWNIQTLAAAAAITISSISGANTGSENPISRLEKKVTDMSAVQEAHFTIVAFTEIAEDFSELKKDTPEDLSWALKVFDAGNLILHTISTDRNPFRQCFWLRHNNIESYIQGKISSGTRLQEEEERTKDCIREATEELNSQHGQSALNESELSREDYQSARNIVGIAKYAMTQHESE